MFAAVSMTAIRVPTQIPWPVIAVALFALGALQVQFYMFHKDDHTLSINLVGLPLVVGAIFTSPSGFMLAVVVAETLTVVRRRDALARAVFNVGNLIAAAVTSRLVMRAFLGHVSPVSPRGWGALVVALSTYEVETVLLVVGAMTLTAGLPGTQYLKSVSLHMAILVPVNAALGIIAVTVAWTQPWALLLLSGAGLLLALWYRSSNTVRSRYANLQQLYEFTVKLAGLSESDQVLQVALGESIRMMHSHHAELCVPVGDHGMRYGLDEGGELVKETVELSSAQRQVIRTREPLLVARDRRDKNPSAGPYNDLMGVPLKLGDDDVGVLLVADRQGEGTTFDSEDLRLFEALAAHLSTALTSSHRLDRLRPEVAAREHQALHDSLTGLANRTLFSPLGVDRPGPPPSDQLVAVMLLDLDGFKDINDTLGHHTGDSILKEVAGRVLAAIGPDRLAARLGGDEFAFVIPAAYSVRRGAGHRPGRPRLGVQTDRHRRPRPGAPRQPRCGHVSAARGGPGHPAQRADVAMYSAKSSKRGVVAYDREIDQNTKRRLILAASCAWPSTPASSRSGTMPVADMAAARSAASRPSCGGATTDYGPISPEEFIPVAEQTGLIAPLTWWVLGSRSGSFTCWRRGGLRADHLRERLGPQPPRPRVVERLSDLLDDVAVSPSSLFVEITESSMMIEPDRSEAVLRRSPTSASRSPSTTSGPATRHSPGSSGCRCRW